MTNGLECSGCGSSNVTFDSKRRILICNQSVRSTRGLNLKLESEVGGSLAGLGFYPVRSGDIAR